MARRVILPAVAAVPIESSPGGAVDDVASARAHPLAPAPTTRKQIAASFQLNLDKGAQLTCPHCGEPGEDTGLSLSLTIGPVLDGLQVLLVQPGASLETVLDDVRRTLIRDAIKRAGGKQSAAAKLLGMKYTTFYALARRLGFGRNGVETDAPPLL